MLMFTGTSFRLYLFSSSHTHRDSLTHSVTHTLPVIDLWSTEQDVVLNEDCIQSLSHPLPLSFSHTQIHKHKHIHTHTHTHRHTQTHTHNHTPAHPHTHTLPLTSCPARAEFSAESRDSISLYTIAASRHTCSS